jgi:hypothetical protein
VEKECGQYLPNLQSGEEKGKKMDYEGASKSHTVFLLKINGPKTSKSL